MFIILFVPRERWAQLWHHLAVAETHLPLVLQLAPGAKTVWDSVASGC